MIEKQEDLTLQNLVWRTNITLKLGLKGIDENRCIDIAQAFKLMEGEEKADLFKKLIEMS